MQVRHVLVIPTVLPIHVAAGTCLSVTPTISVTAVSGITVQLYQTVSITLVSMVTRLPVLNIRVHVRGVGSAIVESQYFRTL